MGLCRQEYWSGLPCPPPGNLPNPGIELMSAMFPSLEDGFFPTSTTWEAHLFAHGSFSSSFSAPFLPFPLSPHWSPLDCYLHLSSHTPSNLRWSSGGFSLLRFTQDTSICSPVNGAISDVRESFPCFRQEFFLP